MKLLEERLQEIRRVLGSCSLEADSKPTLYDELDGHIRALTDALAAKEVEIDTALRENAELVKDKQVLMTGISVAQQAIKELYAHCDTLHAELAREKALSISFGEARDVVLRELARVHSELEIAMRQGGTARTKLMLENRDLRADLEQAKAQVEIMARRHIEEAQRADRAEVACAEYRRRLEIMVREWKEIIGDAESNRTPGDTLERSEHVLKQPNPGQRYLDLEEHLDHTETDRDGLEGLLQQISDAMGCKQYRYTAATKRVLDLAKLVEGLPKCDYGKGWQVDEHLKDGKGTGLFYVAWDYDDNYSGDYDYAMYMDKEDADALAALLAWRQVTPPPREQGDDK